MTGNASVDFDWDRERWPQSITEQVLGEAASHTDFALRVHRFAGEPMSSLVTADGDNAWAVQDGFDAALERAQADANLAAGLKHLLQVWVPFHDDFCPGWSSSVLAYTVAETVLPDGSTRVAPGYGSMFTTGPGGAEDAAITQMVFSEPTLLDFMTNLGTTMMKYREFHHYGGSADGVAFRGGLEEWNLLVIRWTREPASIIVSGARVDDPAAFFASEEQCVAWLAGPQPLR